MKNIKYVFYYIKDRKVPWYKKALIAGSLLYFILPIDIVPDYIIALGWLDDAAVAAFIWNALRSEISDYADAQKKIDSRVIDFEEKRRDK